MVCSCAEQIIWCKDTSKKGHNIWCPLLVNLSLSSFYIISENIALTWFRKHKKTEICQRKWTWLIVLRNCWISVSLSAIRDRASVSSDCNWFIWNTVIQVYHLTQDIIQQFQVMEKLIQIEQTNTITSAEIVRSSWSRAAKRWARSTCNKIKWEIQRLIIEIMSYDTILCF